MKEIIATQAGWTPRSAEMQAKLANLELFLEEMAADPDKRSILFDEALTRESFYQDHD